MKIIAILCIMLIAASVSAGEKTAQVSIFSKPTNVSIRLDSVIIGRTPLTGLKVKPGTHRAEALAPDDGLWNESNQVKIFSVKAGQDIILRFRFGKTVSINSIPYQAHLFWNNQKLGLTPLFLPFEENRGKRFRLEKKGFRSLTFKLERQQPYIYKLEPLTLSQPEDEHISLARSLFHKRLKSKVLLLGGSVIAHWLAFYLKNIADDNYNRYISASDPRLINKYWNNTQKYDRYSDISLGISYALLGGLIYMVVLR
ncbi:MAG TPA: hypothetical protein ENK14_02245 [Caldithrix sp.]|nr:hypothetical protein [Caldithrix sp.]